MASPHILSGKFSGPRAVLPREIPSLLKLINRMFFITGRGLEGEYPHIYGRIEERMNLHRVITHNGEIAAHIGVFPLEFVAPAGRVTAGGIGCVCTREKFRGKGLMARLLEHAEWFMRARGIPLSILWGDRVRYARFGWEPAGKRLYCGLDSRSLVALAPFRMGMRRLSSPAVRAEELHELHRASPFRIERDPETFRLMLLRRERLVFTAFHGRHIAAYAVVKEHRWGRPRRRKRSWAVEEAAGSLEGVLSVFRGLLSRPGIDRLNTAWPLGRLGVPVPLQEAMDGWTSSIGFMGQMRVLDPRSVLTGLGAAPIAPTVMRLGLAPCAQARLMFGPLTPEQVLPGRRTAALSRLPLDLFMWPSDHV